MQPRRYLAALLPVVLSSLALIAAPMAAADKASDAVHETTLDNGLKVLVLPDERAPVVTHQIWYKVARSTSRAGSPGSPTCSST